MAQGPGRVVFALDASDAGQRLDRCLAQRLPELSRARVQALIADGRVLLDGGAARASLRVRAGQQVEVDVPAPEPAGPQPEDLPLQVLYADADLLVIDKPAGLSVHPGAGRRGRSRPRPAVRARCGDRHGEAHRADARALGGEL